MRRNILYIYENIVYEISKIKYFVTASVSLIMFIVILSWNQTWKLEDV